MKRRKHWWGRCLSETMWLMPSRPVGWLGDMPPAYDRESVKGNVRQPSQSSGKLVTPELFRLNRIGRISFRA